MVKHVPALIVGHLLMMYWGRVVRLVFKMRRQYGASANFAPPEPLGKALRIIWVPSVIVWIVHPWITALVERDRFPLVTRTLYASQIPGYVAVAVAAVVFVLTLICWKRMGKSWRMGINPDEKTQLIVSGPYAYVRHPIYALQSVLIVCTMVTVPSPLLIAAGLVVLGFLQWEAHREEKYLVMHHGAAYETYCRLVGRFVPKSLRAYRPQANAGNGA